MTREHIRYLSRRTFIPSSSITTCRRFARKHRTAGRSSQTGRCDSCGFRSSPPKKLQPSTTGAVEKKIPIWQDLYNQGCVVLTEDVKGKLVVVIDDLYQSGATMWAYAEFLKSQGAVHVFG